MSDLLLLPHNIEAEQALLGALLIDNTALERLPVGFEAEAFYDPVHARIFRMAERRIRSDRLATPIILRELMIDDLGLQKLGGPAYLGQLVDSAVGAFNAKDYAETIQDCALRRRMIIALNGILEQTSHEHDGGVAALIDELYADMAQIESEAARQNGPVSMRRVMVDLAEKMQAARDSGDDLRGLTTGIKSLDDIIGGMKSGELIVVGARPGMGKTALAIEIARAAAAARAGVFFVSREMRPELLARRAISSHGAADGFYMPYDLHDAPGEISNDEFAKLAQTMVSLAEEPIIFASASADTVAKIDAELRRVSVTLAQRSTPLGLVIVDYLQLLHSGQRGDRLTHAITEISNDLKALAMRRNVPVLALSQLSRAVESREDKHPQLSDLRESGSIEQDADIILFPFREAYYAEKNSPRVGSAAYAEWTAAMADIANALEITIAKNRMSRTGRVQCVIDLSVNRVRDRHPWEPEL